MARAPQRGEGAGGDREQLGRMRPSPATAGDEHGVRRRPGHPLEKERGLSPIRGARKVGEQVRRIEEGGEQMEPLRELGAGSPAVGGRDVDASGPVGATAGPISRASAGDQAGAPAPRVTPGTSQFRSR